MGLHDSDYTDAILFSLANFSRLVLTSQGIFVSACIEENEPGQDIEMNEDKQV